MSDSKGLQKWLGGRAGYLEKFAQRVDAGSLIRFAVLEYSQSKALQRCSKESILLSLVAAAQLGLEPSGVKGEAYIVPYKTTATLIPGYRGLVKLARESGITISAQVVYEGDQFDIELGSDPKVTHRPCLTGERGDIVGAYAVASGDDIGLEVEWMPRSDLDKIRRSAMRGQKESPAYAEWADQMFRKAPIRRLCKRLPLSNAGNLAVRIDELAEGRDMRSYQRVVDPEGVIDVPADPEPEPPADTAEGVKQQLRMGGEA